MEETRIDLQGGKYTVLHTCGADFRALRNGEEWRSLVGDGLVMAMANEIEDMQSELSVCDVQIAELEHDRNNLLCDREQLRAELAAAKETIMRYETTAENCDLLRSANSAVVMPDHITHPNDYATEFARLNHAPAKAECKKCSGSGRIPIGGAGAAFGLTNRCFECCPVTGAEMATEGAGDE